MNATSHVILNAYQIKEAGFQLSQPQEHELLKQEVQRLRVAREADQALIRELKGRLFQATRIRKIKEA